MKKTTDALNNYDSLSIDNYPLFKAWIHNHHLHNGTLPKYYIRTFGCQQNEADSEIIAGILEQAGLQPVSSYGAADLILINTCSVRENADERFYGHLGSVKHYMGAKKDRILGVCGCMAAQDLHIERIKRSFRYVDFLLQPDQISFLPDFIEESLKSKEIYFNKEKSVHFHEDKPIARQRRYRALVSIMYGCNNFCSYCIVPYTRGRERSRFAEEILKEIEDIAASGIPEVMLLGQNVNAWGKDLSPTAKGQQTFAQLLERIGRIEGIQRIRFMTSHPKDLSDELIDIIGRIKKIEPHLHLPLQSGSNRILAKMNRKYTREKYLEIVRRLRQVRPEITISTDIIVGFPGEEEEDFNDTIDIMEQIRFDSAFTFIYSPRVGTPAADWYDSEGREEVQERFERLVKLQNEHSLQSNQKMIGQILEVLCEGESSADKEILSGRSADNRLVNFRPLKIGEETKNPDKGSTGNSREGEFISVLVTNAKTFSLEGEETCL